MNATSCHGVHRSSTCNVERRSLTKESTRVLRALSFPSASAELMRIVLRLLYLINNLCKRKQSIPLITNVKGLSIQTLHYLAGIS